MYKVIYGAISLYLTVYYYAENLHVSGCGIDVDLINRFKVIAPICRSTEGIWINIDRDLRIWWWLSDGALVSRDCFNKRVIMCREHDAVWTSNWDWRCCNGDRRQGDGWECDPWHRVIVAIIASIAAGIWAVVSTPEATSVVVSPVAAADVDDGTRLVPDGFSWAISGVVSVNSGRPPWPISAVRAISPIATLGSSWSSAITIPWMTTGTVTGTIISRTARAVIAGTIVTCSVSYIPFGRFVRSVRVGQSIKGTRQAVHMRIKEINETNAQYWKSKRSTRSAYLVFQGGQENRGYHLDLGEALLGSQLGQDEESQQSINERHMNVKKGE
jgi:hypothetical protein